MQYTEDINDNASYFGKIQGPLSQGQSIDRDIIVLTDNSRFPGLLIDKGWAEKLDKSAIPNIENLQPALEHPSFDPNREYSLPWQSGMTGIATNTKLTGGKPVTSMDTLLEDPKFKGKVTLLSEMADTMSLVMLANGDDPTKVTDQSFKAAYDRIKKAVDSGQIRQFTGNDYAGPLSKGDLMAAMSWSGDVVQLSADNPNLVWNLPESGGDIWTDNMLIPKGGDVVHRVDLHELRLRPEDRGADRGIRELRDAGQGREGGGGEDRPEAREQPAHLPGRGDALEGRHLRQQGALEPGLPGEVADPARRPELSFLHRHRGVAPYLLLLPGARVARGLLPRAARVPPVPVAAVGLVRLRLPVHVGVLELRRRDLEVPRAADPLVRLRGPRDDPRARDQLPARYWIAFRGGQWKNLLLLAIIAPFFVTYLIRTLAWQTILSDNGFVANTLRSLHLLGEDGRLLATSTAVVAGLTYNFLPFMALPLYVALEQIDPRLIEASKDLYASSTQAFLRVTLPLSLPGVFAGTLLTFIPAAGDFINAQLLGTPKQHMIGNVIQSKFLELIDYPAAAALSFVLMATILAGVLLYARALGSERLTG